MQSRMNKQQINVIATDLALNSKRKDYQKSFAEKCEIEERKKGTDSIRKDKARFSKTLEKAPRRV